MSMMTTYVSEGQAQNIKKDRKKLMKPLLEKIEKISK